MKGVFLFGWCGVGEGATLYPTISNNFYMTIAFKYILSNRQVSHCI